MSRLSLVLRLVALLSLASASAGVSAQTRAQTERRLGSLRTQIQSAERAVASARGEETTALQALEQLDAEIRLREELVAGYRTQVAATRTETETLRQTVDRLAREVEQTKTSYRDRARHAYMYGRRNSLALILAAGSINQMIVRARYLQQFARQRRREIERIDLASSEIQAQEAQVRLLLEATQRSLQQSQAEAVTLGQRRNDRASLVSTLRTRRSGLERQLAQRRTDARQLEGLVQQLATAERQRAAAAAEARRVAAAEAARVAEARRQAEIQQRADAAARRTAEAEQVRRRPTPRTQPPEPAATPDRPRVAASTDARRVDAAPSPEARRTEPAATSARRTEGSAAARRVDTPPAAAPAPRPAPTPRPTPRPAETRAPASPPTNEPVDLSGSFAQNRGRLPWPATGTVTGAFGPRRDPVYGTTVTSIGIDIATEGAAPARAVFGGTVERVGTMTTYGTYVMVSHGSFMTVYGNLSQVTVAQGQAITAGQAVGRAGTSSDRRGTQLFFAIFQDGRAVNPVGWLR